MLGSFLGNTPDSGAALIVPDQAPVDCCRGEGQEGGNHPCGVGAEGRKQSANVGASKETGQSASDQGLQQAPGGPPSRVQVRNLLAFRACKTTGNARGDKEGQPIRPQVGSEREYLSPIHGGHLQGVL